MRIIYIARFLDIKSRSCLPFTLNSRFNDNTSRFTMRPLFALLPVILPVAALKPHWHDLCACHSSDKKGNLVYNWQLTLQACRDNYQCSVGIF